VPARQGIAEPYRYDIKVGSVWRRTRRCPRTNGTEAAHSGSHQPLRFAPPHHHRVHFSWQRALRITASHCDAEGVPNRVRVRPRSRTADWDPLRGSATRCAPILPGYRAGAGAAIAGPHAGSKQAWPAGRLRRKGGRPHSISYRSTPSEKMSERASIGRPSACSGDIYPTVPTN